MIIRRRWAALLVAGSLIAVVLPSTATAQSAVASRPSKPISWLAAGDSYSAGFGLPGAGVPDGGCNRDEQNAWPYQAKAKVATDFPVGRFDFPACTGAVIRDLFPDTITQDRPTFWSKLLHPNEPPRVKSAQWSKATKYDLVTFNFGGNDAGFGPGLMFCVLGSSAGALARGKFDWLTTSLGCPSEDQVIPAIEAAAASYKGFLTNIANEISNPNGKVVVVGYPAVFEEPQRWNEVAKVMNLCHGVNAASVRRVRGWAGLLNARIGQAVDEVNASHPNGVALTFVNVQDGVGNPGPHGTNPLLSPNLFEPRGSSDRHNLWALIHG